MTTATRDLRTAGRRAVDQIEDPYTDPHGEPYDRSLDLGSRGQALRRHAIVAREEQPARFDVLRHAAGGFEQLHPSLRVVGRADPDVVHLPVHGH